MLVDYQGVCESKENHWQNLIMILTPLYFSSIF